VLLLVVVVGAGTVGGAQTADPPALAPLSARFPARGTTPPTAISQLSVEQADEEADPIVVVGFAQGFTLPADNYAVRVLVGDPGAERVRASLVVEGGSPTGTLERGDGSSWESLGATRVSFDPAGQARVEIPGELVADRTAVWVEIDEGGTVVAGTPLFTWPELRGEGDPAVLGVSDFGLVTDGQLVPTGDLVQATDGPRVEYANGSITISFAGPPPTELRGNPAVTVIDYLRFGAEPANGGLPPFYVTIDHTSRQVLLWDGSSGLPTPVPADPAGWLVQGFPPPDPATPAGATPSEIVLSLDGLSQAIGLPVDDPTFGMGIARSVALADARIVTFDGITGLVAWFEGSAAATLPPIEDDIAELEAAPTVPPAPADDGDGLGSAPWIILGLVAALAVVGLVIWAVRRQGDEGDTFTAIGTVRPADESSASTTTEGAAATEAKGGVEGSDEADPSDEGQGSPARTGAPPRAAGVSPDQALAALQRTVEEVTSKLDASVADQAKVKVPGAADEVATKRSSSSPPKSTPPGERAGRPGGRERPEQS
jgi:hypothetical protein